MFHRYVQKLKIYICKDMESDIHPVWSNETYFDTILVINKKTTALQSTSQTKALKKQNKNKNNEGLD